MPDRRFEAIRQLVRCGDYSLSSHVLSAIEQNEFCQDDLEVSILNGTLTESQKDEKGTASDGRKYTICGKTECGLLLETVGKKMVGEDGRYYFVITAYRFE